MRRHLATPQAVVVDTGRDLATVDRDEAGQPLTLDGARELAGRLNAGRRLALQTWRPFRLAPDLPVWLVEEHRGEITGRWLVYAANEGHALGHASDAAARERSASFPETGWPQEADPGYRWTAEAPGVRYEIRKLR